MSLINFVSNCICDLQCRFIMPKKMNSVKHTFALTNTYLYKYKHLFAMIDRKKDDE